ncbi:MAG: hypothetical protein V9F03_05385 [Microthrixaceae bacterium]
MGQRSSKALTGDRYPWTRVGSCYIFVVQSKPVRGFVPVTGFRSALRASPNRMKDKKLALTEKSRAALYTGFSELIDNEEAIQEMLSYFPARDVEEPVTKKFLRAELAETELRLGSNLQSAMTQLRSEMRQMIWINVAALTAFAGVIIAAVRL